jgi:cytoskeletal protein CcmA (bactofilin family)
MWKKDDMTEPERTTPHQPEPGAVTRSQPVRSGGPGDRAVIGRSITVKGDITGDEDLVIQGSVEGSVKLGEHHVTISAEGRIKADIHGRTITVQGQVEGDLFGEEQVILSPSCRVRGNITAPRVALEDGANFRGTIDMESKGAGGPSAGRKSATDGPGASRAPVASTGEDPGPGKGSGATP